ncbi:MAG: terpene cyclase/mutase family protein [Planctomycetes bacterium]|jgi:hypothetical protein|nr:terpene cyclase/mutase family protein [Planctomycetota bacterium]
MMITPEELAFARLVRKKGWVPKDALEQALKDVDRLRSEDPSLTLQGYLAERGLLCTDRIDAAWNVVQSALAAARPAPARARPRREEDYAPEDEDESPQNAVQAVVQYFRNMPFWGASALLYLVVIVLLLSIARGVEEKKPEDNPLVIGPPPKVAHKPPPYDPTRKRDIKGRESVPGPTNKDRKDPVIIKREVDEIMADIPLGTRLENLTNVQIDDPNVGPGVDWQRWDEDPLKDEGGSVETEDAVLAALEWLMRHQNEDGSWSCHDFTSRCDKSAGPCKNHPDNVDPAGGDGRGWKDHDIGVTALAMLAFTGFGHSHRAGTYDDYVEVLKKACNFMRSVQIKGTNDPNYDGCFRRIESIPKDKSKEAEVDEDQQWMYDHAIATMAMGELLATSGDVLNLRRTVEDAAMFCIRAQNEGWAWRYSVKLGDNDTSVTGWMVLALKTVGVCRALGYVSMPSADELDQAYKGAVRWFDHATSTSTGFTGYKSPGDEGSRLPELDQIKGGYPFTKEQSCMTAVSVLCRLFAGQSRNNETIKKGVINVLMKHPPKWQKREGKVLSTINFYYWYYATLAMFQYGGGLWKEWNEKMVDALVPTQRVLNQPQGRSCEDGSWDPIDEWSLAGGRVYVTAMGALTLEVYYRFERARETYR